MESKVFRGFCHNCRNDLIIYRDEEGVSKSVCSRCGAINVSKVMSRRKIQIEVIAPKGEEVM